MLKDGRVLHGGAVNRSNSLRCIITNSVVRPWIRQQENYLITVSPEVLANASEKLLWRLGFQATASRNMVEGYGYFGNGRLGDPSGSLIHVRRIIDGDGYRHLGELSMADLDDTDVTSYSAWQVQQHEPVRTDRYRERLAAIALT